ncbi:MAG: beta-ketoacyl-[acyl-carrier-protein] synthase family protein [Candidatus Omnitrophica bacterium]|nr:beta-ketoacyl-[acyl-carrier-protein] synthase family protein [Candidatus Omnitrophota bacterium]
MDEPIVVTGIGVVSSIGTGKNNFWNALIAGKSGISEITSFDTSVYPTHLGGEVKDFTTPAGKIGRASSLAIRAAHLALDDARLDLNNIDKGRIGVCLGTTMGESQIYQQLNEAWVKKGIEAMDFSLIPYSPPNALAVNVALEFGLSGPNYLIPTACAAGNYCIGYACDLLRKGVAATMLAGGADAFSKLAFTGFNRLLAVAPEKCQPFDKNRKGMIVGEGAALLVLEPLSRATKRNAQIYAQVLGYGLSCDANHMTAPHAAGIAQALEKAMQESKLNPEDVDYINAHGTGTPANDKEECLAIKKVFPGLYKKIPVSSIKSMLGHTMGAASAIESAACCLVVKNGAIPPTINFETPDPECDIDCVANSARSLDVEVVLNNASAFGGNNACVAFRKF